MCVACAPTSDASREKKQEAPPEQPVGEAKAPVEARAPSEAPAAMPVADPELPVAVDAPIEVPADAALVPIRSAAGAPIDVTWREVTRPSEAITFEPVTSGVIARSASGLLDVDKTGALVLRPEIQAPKGTILGSWPGNAWVIETRTVDRGRGNPHQAQHRIMRLRGNRRWVPQEYRYEQRFDDAGEVFAIGGKGGMIVQAGCHPEEGEPVLDCDAGVLTRISDRGTDPELGLDVGGALVGFFETKSGKLYTARQRDGAVYVQIDCEDRECVADRATKLPVGKDWHISRPVARQKHGVTALAEIYDGAPRKFLLHYDSAGWTLDEIAGEPVGLWPTDSGGLWTMIGDALLHRDPNGVWNAIAVPPGATSVSAALHGGELWIAAQVEGGAVVFATASRVTGVAGAAAEAQPEPAEAPPEPAEAPADSPSEEPEEPLPGVEDEAEPE